MHNLKKKNYYIYDNGKVVERVKQIKNWNFPFIKMYTLWPQIYHEYISLK